MQKEIKKYRYESMDTHALYELNKIIVPCQSMYTPPTFASIRFSRNLNSVEDEEERK